MAPTPDTAHETPETVEHAASPVATPEEAPTAIEASDASSESPVEASADHPASDEPAIVEETVAEQPVAEEPAPGEPVQALAEPAVAAAESVTETASEVVTGSAEQTAEAASSAVAQTTEAVAGTVEQTSAAVSDATELSTEVAAQAAEVTAETVTEVAEAASEQAMAVTHAVVETVSFATDKAFESPKGVRIGANFVFVPTLAPLTEINQTLLAFARGEGEAAVAHFQALTRAKSPAEAIRLQVTEIQRAADASLTCFSHILRSANPFGDTARWH